VIELKQIYKSYGKREALHGISFSLKAGEVAAFIGANGVGKTTAMNILTGVLPPDKGSVLINGMDMRQHPMEIKRNIGYLPESNPLYSDMYVREYLEYAASIYLPGNQVKERIEEMIGLTGLEGECSKKIQSLSYGTRQRIGLAQALIHNPGILVLDEPSNGLDPKQQLRLNNLIKELGKEKAILFSSHRLDDVQDVATRYLVLHDGNLVLDEPAENIASIKDYFYSMN
jgi:ABC-2 type transport system ATP-binding protein